MSGGNLLNHELESYITGRGTKGYFFLAHDEAGQWYWGAAGGDHTDPATAVFNGPYELRGSAINLAENWVDTAGA